MSDIALKYAENMCKIRRDHDSIFLTVSAEKSAIVLVMTKKEAKKLSKKLKSLAKKINKAQVCEPLVEYIADGIWVSNLTGELIS